jgi:hypothetical protein
LSFKFSWKWDGLQWTVVWWLWQCRQRSSWSRSRSLAAERSSFEPLVYPLGANRDHLVTYSRKIFIWSVSKSC